ncbi:hypothetical protein [Lonepinella koalarum]|uniref:hypothetical protein n=1 Tax=Lonepinella koalarum TaxID=53417 RepID=UPI0012AB18A9|nr:hypothetical protein [Lonepinella koalarum]
MTKIIEDAMNDIHAISLLHTYYTNLTENDKPIFVTALIGHATTTHKLLEHERMK